MSSVNNSIFEYIEFMFVLVSYFHLGSCHLNVFMFFCHDYSISMFQVCEKRTSY